MRILVLTVLAFSIVCLSTSKAFTQNKEDKPVKIGFIDLKRVYEESGRKELYEKMMDELRREKTFGMNEMKGKVLAMEKMKLELSEEKMKEKDEEIRKLKADLDAFINDANTDLKRKMSEYEREFARELKEVVTKIGDEESYTYILSDVILLYSQPKYDLTETVIAKFKQKEKAPVEKAKGE